MAGFKGQGESSIGGGGGPISGVIAALPGELGSLAKGARRRSSLLGTPIFETPLASGGRIVAAVAGVGKVAAASAAAGLVAEGAVRLLVVGTCGGLRAQEATGDLIHARRAIQWDLAVREGREHASDPDLMEAWCAIAGGERGSILTADRPVVRFMDRLRTARAAAAAYPGPVAADMEAAAVAAVASLAGIPWAALKVISDHRVGWLEFLRAGGSTLGGFEAALQAHGAKPAETVIELCESVH